MLTRPVWIVGWVLCMMVLDTIVMPTWFPPAMSPDWLLVFSTLFGFLTGAPYGLAVGAAAGLLLDILNGRFLGLHVLGLALSGWIGGQLTRHVYRDNAAVALLAVAINSWGWEWIAFSVLRLWGAAGPLGLVLDRLPLVMSVNLVAGAVLFPILFRWTPGTNSIRTNPHAHGD